MPLCLCYSTVLDSGEHGPSPNEEGGRRYSETSGGASSSTLEQYVYVQVLIFLLLLT